MRPYKPSEIGTPALPLRASKLAALVRCPWSGLMMLLGEESGGGKAADTGSAVHFAARAWHTVANKDTAKALKIMQMGIANYPFADLDTAADHFQGYAADPRNQEATCLFVEEKIQVTLPPAEDDPTGQEIVIFGTLDQLRIDPASNVLTVVDIKTGRPDGLEMIAEHCLQLCAYQLGAAAKLSRPVLNAVILRTQDYLKRSPGRVFYPGSWRFSHCRPMLDCVRAVVAQLRRGRVHVAPSADACRWCIGVANCVPALEELKRVA